MYRTITNRETKKGLVIDAYQNGLSIDEICKQYDVSMKTVYRFLSDVKKRNSEITDELAKRVAELYQKNEQIKDIREKTGLCNRSIYKALRKVYLKPKRHTKNNI